MAISPFVSALDFQFNSLDSIKLDENLSLSISASVTEVYDVKIFARSSNGSTLSEIYDGGWRNPYRYIKESFPSQNEYSIKVIKTSDSYELCVRLRKTGKSNYDENCKFITLDEPGSSSPPQSEQSQDDKDENESAQNEIIVKNSTASTSTPTNTPSNTDDPPDNTIKNDSTKGRIVLNPKTSSIKEESSFITKEEKTRLWIVYAFTTFTIIIVILLALRRL